MTDSRPLYSHSQHRTVSPRRQAGKRHQKRPYWMSRRRFQRRIEAAIHAVWHHTYA